MRIQIIVPTINLWDKYTKRAITSIHTAMMRAKQHGIESRILLIDNASTDCTQEEAQKMVSPLFVYKRNEERWGFQKTVNYGVNNAWEDGFEYAFICNNDIILHPESIWRLVERMEVGDLVMATCMDMRGELDGERLVDYDANQKIEVEEAPHPNFSAFMINRACWENVGEMDEGFAPAYFEDNDYHYRIVQAGENAVVFPPALFYHFGSRTQMEADEGGQPIVSSPQFEKNRAYMIEKWGTTSVEEPIYTHPFNDESKSIKWTKQNTI